MGQADIDNQTSFCVDMLLVEDEAARPVVSLLVKATYDIGARGELALAEEQRPICFAGEYFGEPGTSSVRQEPEVAFTKPTTDVVLNGCAYAPHGGATESLVGLEVGPIRKRVHVIGDRVWEAGLFKGISPAQSFERIPLWWEHSFGGSWPDPTGAERHDLEPRNPIGRGYVPRNGQPIDGLPLPNLEYFEAPVRSPHKRVAPAGFGFTYPHWQPRAALAGTFDVRWERARAPRMPQDFDLRHFQAAPADQISARPLAGDEAVVVLGVRPDRQKLAFRLPALEAPRFTLATQWGDSEHQAQLDTVLIDADAMQLVLLWRRPVPLRMDHHEVTDVQVRCEGASRLAGGAKVGADVVPLHG